MLGPVMKPINWLKTGKPQGWKKYALGFEGDGPPPFVSNPDPDDRRSHVPPLGLREYWYPALPDKDMTWKKPIALKICGQRLVFFRDKAGQVQALLDSCPHRGAYLSWGDCYWKGYLSCPYHGATYDGDGNCVEFVTEGPDSKMPGRLKAHKFPTITLKGTVFVWMGEGEPLPPEEDIPPEFFDEKALVQVDWDYWSMNWLMALENTFDAHNAFWVHRNSVNFLKTRLGGRPRTPAGYRVKVVDNKLVRAMTGPEMYYAEKNDGKFPYQMYYPRVGAKWPLHRWRLLWTWWTDRRGRNVSRGSAGSNGKAPRWVNPEGWGGIGFAQVLPGMRRNSFGNGSGSRWCVPVDENLTRLFYISAYWPASKLDWRLKQLRRPWNRWFQFNFQNQDRDVAAVQYQYPEFLSSTDSYPVAFRKLIVEHARGLKRDYEIPEETREESLVYEADRMLGVNPVSEVVSTRKGDN